MAAHDPYKGFFLRLSRLSLLHRIHFHRSAQGLRIYPGQPPILRYIQEHDGCSQRELAEHLQVSPPSIATSIKRMQRAGLLEKRGDGEDLRRSRLHITPLGREQLALQQEIFGRVNAIMFEGFAPGEVEALSSYVERMLENLSREDSRDTSLMALLAREKELLRRKEKQEDRDA